MKDFKRPLDWKLFTDQPLVHRLKLLDHIDIEMRYFAGNASIPLLLEPPLTIEERKIIQFYTDQLGSQYGGE